MKPFLKTVFLVALILAGASAALSQDALQTAKKVYISVNNASVTGTTRYRLAKLTGAPSTAVIAATTDTDGVIGIVTGGAGTSGVAAVQTEGQVACDFDGATTAGDYVQISTTTGGKCHDTGAGTYPSSGQVLGRVLSTNGSSGNYQMILAPGVKSFGAGFTGSGTANKLTKFTAATALGDSGVSDDGTTVSTTEAVDLSGASSLKPPNSAGAAPTIEGTVAFDTTSHTLEYGENGTNRTVANLDGAQTITGIKTLSPAARSSGAASYLTINPPSDTGITTATESIGVNFATGTRTFIDGTIALQRERFFAGPTYNKTTTSLTVTDVFNSYFTPPVAGTGVTFTRPHTFGIVDATSASSSITGGFVVATTLGTTATSVGIGGGNINAGGNGTFGGTFSVTGHTTFEGVTSTGATGTGKFVYDTSPTIATPIINSAAHVGGTWVADATWTLPAHTLGGTVSGGGNQINNVIIGASTPLAGSFTTLSASGGLQGTATNDSATAGYLGELISSSVVQGSAVSLSTGTAANVTSITLTAGDWDVWGDIQFLSAATTTISAISASISTTSATGDFTAGRFGNVNYPSGSVLGVSNTTAKAGPVRISVAGSTTVYLVAFQTFGTSTLTGWGFLGARRRR